MTSIKFRALTHEDHKLFFEALGEYGKDFGNIQQYMAQKSGKNNIKSSSSTTTSLLSYTSSTTGTTATTNSSILNHNDPQRKREQDKKEDDRKREQIRNFYNKLHTKLSQLIDYKVDDRIEKVNQELYLLINYGEIWKKHGFKFKFDDKTKKLLKELVYQGYTTYRYKNKNVRLRTPPCRALKKINEIGIDEKVKVVTTRELPKDVIVELHPATNRDWIHVQSLSQNPRVRARLSIQKRISKLLEFLEGKWNIEPDYIRLKPSARHELKEVNITRVIPDNHLDLSLNAYINRLGSRTDKVNKTQNDKDSSSNNNLHGQIEISQSVMSIGSPDNSTMAEPSIAKTRKHLNLLQILTGSLENGESRTAYEILDDAHSNNANLGGISTNTTTTAGTLITSALYDEDAVASAHDSRSVDFQIPKNVTLGEFFKMAGCDESKHAVINESEEAIEQEQKVEEEEEDCNDDSNLMRTHIMKLAEGWTRQDKSSITIGELYLAFKCPERIILEYSIEKFQSSNDANDQTTKTMASNLNTNNNINNSNELTVEGKTIQDSSPPLSNDILIFKLLTAASLSLAHIERQKQEQQHKLHEQQTCSKFKRRKVPGQGQQTMTLHDIEVTNQSVKEALKQLQPTRLSSYRRAR